VLAKLILPESEGALVNALEHDSLVKHLAQLYEHKAGMRWRSGVLEVEHLERNRGEEQISTTTSVSARITQLLPDTVVTFDERHRMRLRRALQEGSSINTEMLGVLNHNVHFFGVPKLWCTLSYKRNQGKRYEIASFETLPPNECSLLELLTKAIEYQTAGILAREQQETVGKSAPIFDDERIAKAFSLLGKQIAALHNALAKEQSIEFAPEAFTMHYQRSIYQTLRSEIRQTIDHLEQKYSENPEFSRHLQSLMNNEDRMLRLLKTIFDIPMQGKKIRLYGSRDLGTIFFTQDRIILTDFEGDTSKAITERRLKRSPLRDVAFLCHAIFRVVVATVRRAAAVDTDIFSSNILVGMLYHHIEKIFLESYLDTVDAALLPHTKEAIFPPLKAFALMRSFQTLREQIETDSTELPDILAISSAFSQLQLTDSFSVF